MFFLELTDIICYEKKNTQGNYLMLMIDGQNHAISIKPGETKQLFNFLPINFAGFAKIELYEAKHLPENLIDCNYVNENDLGSNMPSLKFASRDKNGKQEKVYYQLNYQIIQNNTLNFCKLKCEKTLNTSGCGDEICFQVNETSIGSTYFHAKEKSVTSLSFVEPIYLDWRYNKVSLWKIDELNCYDHQWCLGEVNIPARQGTQEEEYVFSDYSVYYKLEVENSDDYHSFLVKKITDSIGYPADGSKKVSRQDLGLSDKMPILLDLGGEGYKEETPANPIFRNQSSGFKGAINLNNRETISTDGKFETKIPHLIYIKDWQQDLPLADNFVDYLTMQGCPLTEKGIKEIVRVLKPGGKVGLWLNSKELKAVKVLEKKLNSERTANPYDESPQPNFKKIEIISHKEE